MTIILLIIIYLAFISLGLPDSLLGAAWPTVSSEWGVSMDSAGLVAMFITSGTVVSSFLSGYFIKKIGTGKIVFASCLMTGLSLMGFSFAPSYIWLILLGIPLGFGGGTVDASLNNYVALHYKSHHMNWLHSFWGVGATLGPIILGSSLSKNLSWQIGYRNISIIQLCLAVILMFSLPLWDKHRSISPASEPAKSEKHKIVDMDAFKIKGVKYSLASFVAYCAIEASVGLWGSSFLVHSKNIPEHTAAYWIAFYYGSIMVGRFISGFVSLKLENKKMIRYGALIAFIGAVLMITPLTKGFALIPFVLIGLGLSPIFPAMIHETPARFGKEKSQTIIGYQMAFAYIGIALFPPLYGLIIENISISLFPILLFVTALMVVLLTERLNSVVQKR